MTVLWPTKTLKFKTSHCSYPPPFDLESLCQGLCQSQTVLWLFCDQQRPSSVKRFTAIYTCTCVHKFTPLLLDSPTLLLRGWVHLIEGTNDLNQSMETIDHIEQQTCQWHRSWLLICTLVYDVVEAHVTALTEQGCCWAASSKEVYCSETFRLFCDRQRPSSLNCLTAFHMIPQQHPHSQKSIWFSFSAITTH